MVMPHPLQPDLSNFSLEELQARLSTLYKQLEWASRTGNSGLNAQLNMLITSYSEQYRIRVDESLERSASKNSIRVE